MQIGHKAGWMDLNYAMFFEPEDGINTAEEFTNEILSWANREKKDLVILEEGMEPKIELDKKQYICKLGDPEVARQNNPVWKAMMGSRGITHSIGTYMGYKWVYLYEV